MTKRFLETLSELKTDGEKKKYLEEKIKELPIEIVTNAVEKLSQAIRENNPELFNDLVAEKDKFGYEWVGMTYFGFGLRVRNMLRDLVCDDDELPEGDWTFYYAQLVEMSLGLW